MSDPIQQSNAEVMILVLEFRAISGLAVEYYAMAADRLRQCDPDTPLWDAATNRCEERLKDLDAQLRAAGHSGFDVSRRVDWPETIER